MKIAMFTLLITSLTASAAVIGVSPYSKTTTKSKYKFQVTKEMCSYHISSIPVGSAGFVTCKAKLLNLPQSMKNRHLIAYDMASLSTREEFSIDPKNGYFEFRFWDSELVAADMPAFIRDVLIDFNREPVLISIGPNPSEFGDI